jgi:hypothetical protein
MLNACICTLCLLACFRRHCKMIAYIHACVCVCVYVYTCRTYIYIYIYIRIYTQYMYVNIYTYIHTHAHTHTHTCMQRSGLTIQQDNAHHLAILHIIRHPTTIPHIHIHVLCSRLTRTLTTTRTIQAVAVPHAGVLPPKKRPI